MSVDSIGAVAPIAKEWDELADRAAAPPWLRPGWFEAWWEAFGKGNPEILFVRRQGCIRAVLATARRRGEIRSIANSESPRFAVLFEDPEDAAMLRTAVFERRPRRVSMLPLDALSETQSEWRSRAEGAGYTFHARRLRSSPYIELTGGWESYVASRPAKLQAEIRRRRRRLEEQGAVEVLVTEGDGRLDRLLDEAFRIEASGWKGRERTAIELRRDAIAFYRGMAKWAASRGELRLAFLRVAGTSIAFDLSIEDKRAHYLLKTSYDPAYARFAPGTLLRYGMLGRCFGSRLERYDFLGGADPWKLQWASDTVDVWLMLAFSPSPAGRIDRFGKVRLRSWIKGRRATPERS